MTDEIKCPACGSYEIRYDVRDEMTEFSCSRCCEIVRQFTFGGGNAKMMRIWKDYVIKTMADRERIANETRKL